MSLEHLTAQSANNLFGLFNALKNVVFWIRSSDYQRQLFVSQAYENLWGLPCESLYAHPEGWMDTVVTTATVDKVTAFDTRCSQGYTGTLLFQIRDSEGNHHWIKDQSCVLIDAEQRILAVIGVGELITERQKDSFLQTPQTLNDNTGLQDFIQLACQAYTVTPATSSQPVAPVSETGCYMMCNGQTVWVSRREKHVLTALMKGQSAKQTAYGLGISIRTVETYLDNLRKKTGCRSKLALVGKLKVAQ